MRRLATLSVLAALVPAGQAGAQLPAPDLTVQAARDTEPVILHGSALGEWSARSNHTLRLPLLDFMCEPSDETHDCHNHFAEPNADTQTFAPQEGFPVERLVGYAWRPQPGKFQKIPLQVDEMFERYLANPASGFSIYSGEDKHLSYAFDREGFRFTESDPQNSCVAQPRNGIATTPDPVRGLDDNDEIAFMARDGGPAAPAGEPLPPGILDARRVTVADPADPAGARYVYIGRAAAGGPEPSSDGYVTYERDAISETFEKSESTYDDYGNAARGPYCDAEGNVVLDENGEPDIQRRRPRDYAWISSDRYRYRYDGRWLMTRIHISGDGGQTYGPDLVDRWKARAFQQDPASETPCCGFEEEDTNWGGSSTLLGEKAGPVRVIRETWGADSGTNVIRRESFYGEEMRQTTFLRVHVIPPLDGIYAQWDFNAGQIDRYYSPRQPTGVPVDGSNDEVYGNLDDPCNPTWDRNDTSAFDQGYRSLYEQMRICDFSPYHQSIDLPDLTFSDANVGTSWAQMSGPAGTIVDRYTARLDHSTAGGTPQQVLAVPYYRDDACFDDGTGSDPGPRINLRQANERQTWGDPPQPRECWEPADGVPDGSERFFQGSIGTHGVHFLFVAESDNARATIPTTEIVGEQRMVMLPGQPGNVGERYGRGFEKPLVAAATPAPNPAR